MKLFLAVLWCTMVAVFCGCDADRVTPPSPASQNPYKALTSKDDVLFNLQLLYPQYDCVEYNQVLDDDLIFFFSKDDIGTGFTEFAKSDEIRTLQHIGDDSRPDRVLSIELTLSYSEEEWTPITPEDQKYAGETWYQKTVVYNMIIQAVPDMTFVCTDVNAQFTIREGENNSGKKIWRIIRWRDAIKGGSARSLVAGSAQVQTTTWGAIKAVYH
ncbi:MAG: hypothetical protein KAJ17_06250 [Candidatus Krumholzibacteria bacterium]|nr:hypothetical protein [Candidatus Krumholzibacteria bacterium]